LYRLRMRVHRPINPRGSVRELGATTPPFSAMFPFVMLGTTPYTGREYEEMGRAAGLETITISPVPPTPESFITFI
jgi:hypothetical protein